MDIRRFFRKYILPLILSLLVTSCFSDFDPDIDTPRVLCMTSLITEGDSIKVSLSHTWRWTDSGPKDFYGSWGEPDEFGVKTFVKDALVKLYVNDEYRETLKIGAKGYDPFKIHNYPWSFTGYIYYIADYIPQRGDIIRLEAESEEYGLASAEVVVPQPVMIDKVDYSVSNFSDRSTLLSEWYLFNLNLSVWFTDPAQTVDYYMFETASSPEIYKEDGEATYGIEHVSFNDVTDDPLFSEHVSALDHAMAETSGYTVFSDRQISGKSYPIHARLESVCYELDTQYDKPGADKTYIDLILYSISSSYYKHLISVWAANDGIVGSLGNVGLADPVFVASNVSTGAGVVAAATKYEYKLYLQPLIEQIKNMQQQ